LSTVNFVLIKGGAILTLTLTAALVTIVVGDLRPPGGPARKDRDASGGVIGRFSGARWYH
jgi:hypothetical protein